jgi:hypothetical protein
MTGNPSIGSVFYGEDTPASEEITEQVPELEQETTPPEQEANELEPSEEVKPDEEQEQEEVEQEYYELDGEHYTVDQLKEFKDNGLMRKDYSQKTEALSVERKELNEYRESERESIAQERQSLTDLRQQLEVLVKEDGEVDWADLKENDPDRYIELKERQEKRSKALAEIKQGERREVEADPVELKQELEKFQKSIPQWFNKDGTFTDKQAEDVKIIQKFATSEGFTQAELSSMSRAKDWKTLLYAAKYDEHLQKKEALKLKKEQAPKIIAPKSKKPQGEPKTLGSVLYGT